MRKVYIFLADLHIGHLMDYKALEVTIAKLRQLLQILKSEERILYVLGNLTEGYKIREWNNPVMHPVQQAKYASYVIKWIANKLAVDKVVIVPGSNDLYIYNGKSVILMIKNWLEKLDVNAEVVNEGHVIEIGRKKVMLRHTIEVRPWSYDIDSIPEIYIPSLLYTREYNVDTIICSHYHVFVMSPELILLPSFQWSDNPIGKDRGGVLMTDDGLVIPIVFKQITDYSRPEAIHELYDWLHNIEQRLLSDKENKMIRLCIDYKGGRKIKWLPIELYEEIKSMLKTGTPIKTIAKNIGVSPTTIRFVKNGYEC